MCGTVSNWQGLARGKPTGRVINANLGRCRGRTYSHKQEVLYFFLLVAISSVLSVRGSYMRRHVIPAGASASQHEHVNSAYKRVTRRSASGTTLPSHNQACAVRADEVLAVAPARAVETRAGDVLWYLKGVTEGRGMTALRMRWSPQWDGDRLVLTVDTAVNSGKHFLAG